MKASILSLFDRVYNYVKEYSSYFFNYFLTIINKYYIAMFTRDNRPKTTEKLLPYQNNRYLLVCLQVDILQL